MKEKQSEYKDMSYLSVYLCGGIELNMYCNKIQNK